MGAYMSELSFGFSKMASTDTRFWKHFVKAPELYLNTSTMTKKMILIEKDIMTFKKRALSP